MNRMHVQMGAAVLAGLAALSGCAHPRNESLALHDTVRLPALGPPQRGIVLTSDAPSVTSVDRADWAATPILVPVDGTAHYPTYVRVRSTVKRTARQRGEYPSAESALDFGAQTETYQQTEALIQPVRAVGNALLMPIRMIFYRRPGQTLQSPREAYERSWIRPGEATGPAVTATPPQP